MRTRIDITGTLIAVCLGLIPYVGVTAAGEVKTTEAVALHTADVPRGFRQVLAVHHNNRTAAGATLSLATLEKNGRITDYETTYSRRPQKSRYTQIDDIVTAYKDNRGARWDYNYVVLKMKGTHVLKLPRVGTSSAGFRTTVPVAKAPPEVIDFIVFYRGNDVVSLTIEGPYGTVNGGELVRLARIIDRRIR